MFATRPRSSIASGDAMDDAWTRSTTNQFSLNLPVGTVNPLNTAMYHHPYFTPAQADTLSARQRGKLSVGQEEKARQQACGFIEAVGARLGLYVQLSTSIGYTTFIARTEAMPLQPAKDDRYSSKSLPPILLVLPSRQLQLPCESTVLRDILSVFTQAYLRMSQPLLFTSLPKCTIHWRNQGKYSWQFTLYVLQNSLRSPRLQGSWMWIQMYVGSVVQEYLSHLMYQIESRTWSPKTLSCRKGYAWNGLL